MERTHRTDMAMDTMFDPGKVLFNPPGGSTSAYIGLPAMKTTDNGSSGTPSVGPEAVRATAGPFDSAYRQNLATYAGGNFFRPGGSLAFDPTSTNPLPGSAPTGGGTAPVAGLPTSLVAQAIGGSPFSWTPPPPPDQSSTQSTQSFLRGPGRFWLNQLGNNGNLFRSSL